MDPRSSSAKKGCRAGGEGHTPCDPTAFSAEDKIRIVVDGLRSEDSIAELCRKEEIAQSLYYTWSKEFMEAGKRRLAGDTARAATTDEVKDLRREASALKECVADLTLESRLLKKAYSRMGTTRHEISRIRKARDHQTRRAVTSASAAHAGPAGHPTTDLLSLVRALYGRRP
jgi:transposase